MCLQSGTTLARKVSLSLSLPVVEFASLQFSQATTGQELTVHLTICEKEIIQLMSWRSLSKREEGIHIRIMDTDQGLSIYEPCHEISRLFISVPMRLVAGGCSQCLVASLPGHSYRWFSFMVALMVVAFYWLSSVCLFVEASPLTIWTFYWRFSDNSCSKPYHLPLFG